MLKESNFTQGSDIRLILDGVTLSLKVYINSLGDILGSFAAASGFPSGSCSQECLLPVFDSMATVSFSLKEGACPG